MKYFIPCITIIICFFSCSKKNDDPKPEEKVISLHVVEYKTDSPIAGAWVEFYSPCPACGMLGYAKLIFRGSTTAGGYCDVPESVFNDEYYGISITPTAPNQNPVDWFYDGFTSTEGHSPDRKYRLPIKGEEYLHLIKTNDFPTGYYIEFKGQGEQPLFNEFIARVYGFPSDTSFSIVTYRAQLNSISWNIYDARDSIISSGGPLLVELPKSGIQKLEIKY